MTELLPLDAAAGAIAQRIRFLDEAPPGTAPLAAFADPYRRLAVAEELTPGGLLGDKARGRRTADELEFLFLPGGSATPIEWQRAAEEWVAASAPAAGESPRELSATDVPAIDVTLQSDRVVWRPGRAVAIGNVKRLAEVRAALVNFSFHEGELRKLERELAADWPQAESDVLLAHGVDRRPLAESRHVGEMSRRSALRRIRFARLEPRLEKASTELSGPARRWVAELALQAEVVDRLRHVDDQLEVFEDLYELANDRLAEFSFYRSESRLEVWIIVILLFELALMGFEIWWTWWLES